ncbi:MAG: lytic transglycosylase domain-containing protein [Actinomycetota bacterium]
MTEPDSGPAVPMTARVVAAPVAMVVFLLAACGSSSVEEGKAGDAAGRATTTTSDEDGDVVISVIDTPDTDAANEPDGDPEPEPEPDVQPEVAPDRRPLPESAAAMVPALDAAELAVRDGGQTVADRAAWGRRQQSLYRHLANNPEWVPTVLAETDPAIRGAVELNWTARENLSLLLATETLHDELPAWRVEPPAPAEELIGYYKEAEEAWGIQWEFLAGINLIETRMGRIQGVSSAGAIGPMQFLPTTWAECCDGDPTTPQDAIIGAAKYLTIRGGPENMDRAIWGYNNSDYYVNAVTAYANVLMADEQAYHGYHAWEIYFLSTEGLLRIPVGYEQLEPVPAADWLADNPDALFAD